MEGEQQTPSMRIDCESLILRPFQEQDVDRFVEGMEAQSDPVDEYDWFANMDAFIKRDPQASRRSAFEMLVSSQEDASILGNPGLRFQIFTRETECWMGYLAIYDARLNVESAAMDYYLLNQFWRRGVATEAVKAMLKFCWEVLRLHRIEATIEEGNVRSLRFAESIGMTFEGIRRHGARINGEWKNLCVYSELATSDV